MNAPSSVIPAIGQPLAGGIFAGRFFVGELPFALIVAPKQEGEFQETPWSKTKNHIRKTKNHIHGAVSVYDGLANTAAMAEAGSPLAKRIRQLDIAGFTDWYLPARGELLLAYAAGIEGDEAFDEESYWSSTQFAHVTGWAWCQLFNYGHQYFDLKDSKLRARAVRRLPL